jgi:Post-segregation antitoxin CcdA
MQNPKTAGYRAGQKRRLYDIESGNYSRDQVPAARSTDPDYIESYRAGYQPIEQPTHRPKVKKNVRVDADGLEAAQKLGLNISKICSDAILEAVRNN